MPEAEIVRRRYKQVHAVFRSTLKRDKGTRCQALAAFLFLLGHGNRGLPLLSAIGWRRRPMVLGDASALLNSLTNTRVAQFIVTKNVARLMEGSA